MVFVWGAEMRASSPWKARPSVDLDRSCGRATEMRSQAIRGSGVDRSRAVFDSGHGWLQVGDEAEGVSGVGDTGGASSGCTYKSQGAELRCIRAGEFVKLVTSGVFVAPAPQPESSDSSSSGDRPKTRSREFGRRLKLIQARGRVRWVRGWHPCCISCRREGTKKDPGGVL